MQPSHFSARKVMGLFLWPLKRNTLRIFYVPSAIPEGGTGQTDRARGKPCRKDPAMRRNPCRRQRQAEASKILAIGRALNRGVTL